MQYNLIRNSSFTAVSGTGYGNKILTWAELETLIDGTVSTGSVSLTPSDILCLSVDLSNRIKVDGIRLYLDDMTKLANVEFKYKNTTSDSYSTASKSVSGSYYAATIPDPSSPRFVTVTVSGISATVYEFQVFNDDYIVAYGVDGSQYDTNLYDTAIGEDSGVVSVPIYNNGTDIATAYTVIDYTGEVADDYVRIAVSTAGTWYSINDGVLVEDNNESSDFIWNMGTFSGTTISGSNVVLDSGYAVGTYTSPIMKLTDKYLSSYFMVDGTTTSGLNSISYDSGSYNGTIRVRSSDTAPVSMNDIYWYWREAGGQHYITKAIAYDGSQDDTSITAVDSAYFSPISTAMDRRTGYVYTSTKYSQLAMHGSYIHVYDTTGSLLHSVGGTNNAYKYVFDVAMEIDKFGGVWGYGSTGYYLYHLDSALSATALYSLYDGGDDFIYDLAVELDGPGVWYTNKNDNLLVHKESDGTTISTIVLNSPRALCGDNSNGCWVMDTGTSLVKRYDSDGNLLTSITMERTATRMAPDFENGFWYYNGNTLYHVNNLGTEDISVSVGSNISKVEGGRSGCMVWSDTNGWVKWVDQNTASVAYTFTNPSAYDKGMPGVRAFSYSDFQETQEPNTLPASYDSTWSSLSWAEIRKDGYFLPKNQYHQVEVTLRRSSTSDPSPVLEKILMPPAIKTQSIQASSSQNMYVKCVIPSGASIDDYEARLKTWWGV